MVPLGKSSSIPVAPEPPPEEGADEVGAATLEVVEGGGGGAAVVDGATEVEGFCSKNSPAAATLEATGAAEEVSSMRT